MSKKFNLILQEKYNKEVLDVETEAEKAKDELIKKKSQFKVTEEKLVQLEMESEDMEKQIRFSESIINDLEQKLDASLEEIALLQSELEEIKSYSEEQIQRLKQQLDETQMEFEMKERELKKLKFMALINDQPRAQDYMRGASPNKKPRGSIQVPMSGNSKDSGCNIARLSTIDPLSKLLNFQPQPSPEHDPLLTEELREKQKQMQRVNSQEDLATKELLSESETEEKPKKKEESAIKELDDVPIFDSVEKVAPPKPQEEVMPVIPSLKLPVKEEVDNPFDGLEEKPT